MNALLTTLWHHIALLIRENILIPLIFGVAVISIVAVYRKKSRHDLTKKQGIFTFLFSFFWLFPFQITLISRIGKGTVEPLKDIFGGWIITRSKYAFELGCIENVLMFMPFGILFCMLLISKGCNAKRTLFDVTAVSFLMTAFIETTQLLTKLGTFQISDLVYNTLGGLIGAGLYIIINRKIKQKKAT